MSHKNLTPIGSAVLTFIGYKQTNRQTDRQAKFIYRCWFFIFGGKMHSYGRTTERMNKGMLFKKKNNIRQWTLTGWEDKNVKKQSQELTRVNPDRNIFSINVELTSTFLLYRGLVHHHHWILNNNSLSVEGREGWITGFCLVKGWIAGLWKDERTK